MFIYHVWIFVLNGLLVMRDTMLIFYLTFKNNILLRHNNYHYSVGKATSVYRHVQPKQSHARKKYYN